MSKMKLNRDHSEMSASGVARECRLGSNAEVLCTVPYRTRVTDTPAVELSPIGDGQVDQVAEFLHRELNPRVAAEAWAKGIGVQWVPDAPNHGFMLIEDGKSSGQTLLFTPNVRSTGDASASAILELCVSADSRRAHAIRLVRAILRQPGYHFTDFSPSGNVIELNRRLGFHSLDNSTALQINWPVLPRSSVSIITDEVEIEHRLSGRDLQIFRDHRGSAAAHHLLVTSGPELCYVIGRRDRRKRLPVFLSVLYVSNAELFRRSTRHVAHHFLVHTGALATLLETRITGHPPQARYHCDTHGRRCSRAQAWTGRHRLLVQRVNPDRVVSLLCHQEVDHLASRTC